MPTNEEYEKAAQEKYSNESQENKESQEPKNIHTIESVLQSRTSEERSYPNGYIPFKMEDLPSKGRFYESGSIISIRAAQTKEIEHWSTMNEEDIIDVSVHYKDILISCVSFKKYDGTKLSAKDLLEADKMVLLLAIKDLTFTKSQNILNLDIECPHCGHINKRELDNTILSSRSESDETLEKYYNSEERKYIINTKSYGQIRMSPPTVGVWSFVLDWGRKMTIENRYWDKAFFQALPFMDIDWRDVRTVKDGKGKEDLTKKIREVHLNWKAWDIKKKAIFTKMSESMKIGVDPVIKINCDDCHEEVESPFRFPDGPKSLFVISNISDELL